MKRMSRLALVVTLLTSVQLASTGAAYSASPGAEEKFVELINHERATVGKPALAVHSSLRAIARNWTDSMISDGRGCGASLAHNPSYTKEYPSGWTRAAENVGCGQSVESLHKALMSSEGHRNNILGDFSHIGVGVGVDSAGTMWVTQNFMKHPDQKPEDTNPVPDENAIPVASPEGSASEPVPVPAPNPGASEPVPVPVPVPVPDRNAGEPASAPAAGETGLDDDGNDEAPDARPSGPDPVADAWMDFRDRFESRFGSQGHWDPRSLRGPVPAAHGG